MFAVGLINCWKSEGLLSGCSNDAKSMSLLLGCRGSRLLIFFVL